MALAGACLAPGVGLPLAAAPRDQAPIPQAAPAVPAAPTAMAPADAPAAEAMPAAEAPAPAPAVLPLAPKVKGSRPKSNPKVLTPAATKLDLHLRDLAAPASLALPTSLDQVRIQELRPLALRDVENLAEVNSPFLKAYAMRVDEAKSDLRARIAAWYPTVNLNAQSLPALTNSEDYTSKFTNPNRTTNPRGTATQPVLSYSKLYGTRANLAIDWALINPQRVPSIAAARDKFEQAKNDYLISLRDLRLQAAQSYFELQLSDDRVRIGQESVRASLVSLRDARARFQAGVATKLEVLEAETQLARDQQLLTDSLSSQSQARRRLAQILDLPQTITPTAKEPLRVLGVWTPSLQESILAAYAFREELDNVLLDISISNSQANFEKGAVQPFLNLFDNLSGDYANGGTASRQVDIVFDKYSYTVNNTVGLNLTWNLFDGGAANANARSKRQQALENTYKFADKRDEIRFKVEESFYKLSQTNRNIQTTSREVMSARESLRLARLRFQAGVSTQREVVDNQRDLTNAEVRYSTALAEYNTNLAEIRRRTGLDQIAVCQAPSLPSTKPSTGIDVPVPPEPLQPACQASARGNRPPAGS